MCDVAETEPWWCTTTSATSWNSLRTTTIAISEVDRLLLLAVQIFVLWHGDLYLSLTSMYVLQVSVDGSGYDGVALRQSRSNLGYTSTAGMRGTNILFAGGDSDGPGDPFNRTTFSARSQVLAIVFLKNSLEFGFRFSVFFFSFFECIFYMIGYNA